MTDKTLKDVAIDIKWKKYVLVSDRVIYFNETYPNGSIATERFTEWDMEIIKATVTPDCDKPNRVFTWYSQAKRGDWFINKTAALENCETSAVGRALAFMWIGVIDSIASVDEIKKAESQSEKKETPDDRFDKTLKSWEWFMKQCLDEDDCINKVKVRIAPKTMTQAQEIVLRNHYRNVTKQEKPDNLFN